jgi:hypothetical protein
MKVQHYKRLQSKKGVLLFKNRKDKIKMLNMRFKIRGMLILSSGAE